MLQNGIIVKWNNRKENSNVENIAKLEKDFAFLSKANLKQRFQSHLNNQWEDGKAEIILVIFFQITKTFPQNNSNQNQNKIQKNVIITVFQI